MYYTNKALSTMTESDLLNALENAKIDSQSELIVNALNALAETTITEMPVPETTITEMPVPKTLDAVTQQSTVNSPVKSALDGDLMPSAPLPELETLAQVLDGIMSLEGRYIDHAYKLCITISVGNLADNFKLLNGLKSKTKGTLAGIARAYVVMADADKELALKNLQSCSNIEHVTKVWGGSGILPTKQQIISTLPDTPASIRDIEPKAYMAIGANGKASKIVEKVTLEKSNEALTTLISDSLEATPETLKVSKEQLDQMILDKDYNVEEIFESSCASLRSNKFKSLLLKISMADAKIKTYEKDKKEKTTAMTTNYKKFKDLQKFITTELDTKGFDAKKILAEAKRLGGLDKLDYKDELVAISMFKSTSRTINQVAKQAKKTKRVTKTKAK